MLFEHAYIVYVICSTICIHGSLVGMKHMLVVPTKIYSLPKNHVHSTFQSRLINNQRKELI